MNLKALKHLDRNDVLHALGLEAKSSTAGWMAETIGTFGVGLLVGAGIGLILAPKAGRELRGDIRDRLRNAPEDISGKLHGLVGRDSSASAIPGNGKTI